MQDGAHDGHTLPLKGVVLCSTSLPQDARMLLGELSDSMGAIHRLDLTTDVTHLIVGQVDTPKYKHVAKERPDIHVLRSDWIQAMRNAWTSGEDFDVNAIVEEHRLPTLYGLQICVTGFGDLDQRQDIMRIISEHGGTYNGDLTKVVTHLIAKTPEGPKYDRAKQWGLKIVSLKWFEESLERGMALEEALYDPLRPEHMQGQGAFVRGFKRESSLGKRAREDVDPKTALPQENGKRKMRRTMSARLNTHSQSLWAEISAVEDKQSVKNEDQWREPSQTADGIHTGPEEDLITREITPALSVAVISQPVSRAIMSESKRGLFSDCLFLAIGHPEKRAPKILQILQNEGGQIADFPEDLYSAVESESHAITVLIVPSEWTANTREPLPDVPADTWLVTEWWIERCIVSKSVIDPGTDIYSQHRLHLPNTVFTGMIFGTSGLGNDAKNVKAIAEHAGAKYEQSFNPTCSLLIVRSTEANQEKIAYAMKYDIPVVSEAWLQSSLKHGERLPMRPYQLPLNKPPSKKQSRGDLKPQEPARRKDESLAQRLSVTRKKSVTPSLKLVKSRHNLPPLRPGSSLRVETKRTTRPSMPFVEDDGSPEDLAPPPYIADVQLDGARSQPLRDLPPQTVNSMQKRSQESGPTIMMRPESTVQVPEASVDDSVLVYPDTGNAHTNDADAGAALDENTTPALDNNYVIVPDDLAGNQEPSEAKNSRLNEDIKSLLDRRKEAPPPLLAEGLFPGRRRKERKLGRAPSNMSNPSAPTSFLHSRSIEIADSTASGTPLDSEVPLPSQQLGYETADAKEHRARMSKRMGTNFNDGEAGIRVESIGVVKDVDADSGGAGVGGRVRGRHRQTNKA